MEEGEGSVIDAAEALAIENAQKAYDDALKSYNEGVDAAEALAIENAQKAYDDALKSYNEGVDQESELTKAKEELEELKLSAKSETFSPTNAYASESPIIIGSYISDIGSAVSLNSQLYNISSIGIEVVFQVDASDQETVSLGDSVEIELPTDERVPTIITFIDQVVTQTQAGEFIEVILEVLNPNEIEAYDQAPVKVFVTTEVSENVLFVPVNALLALAEGGYALEVYEGEAEDGIFQGESGVDTSYVAVEIGVFTDGFVEVKGNISEGQIVVVPR
jgi:exonuclease VII small subunit